MDGAAHDPLERRVSGGQGGGSSTAGRRAPAGPCAGPRAARSCTSSTTVRWTPAELDVFRPLLKRRARREPLQYILGSQRLPGAGSRGRRPGADSPPRDRGVGRGGAALGASPGGRAGRPRSVDIGVGSGAIALSLAAWKGRFGGWWAPTSPARRWRWHERNRTVAGLGARVELRHGADFAPLTIRRAVRRDRFESALRGGAGASRPGAGGRWNGSRPRRCSPGRTASTSCVGWCPARRHALRDRRASGARGGRRAGPSGRGAARRVGRMGGDHRESGPDGSGAHRDARSAPGARDD